jgi:hypothetical protein
LAFCRVAFVSCSFSSSSDTVLLPWEYTGLSQIKTTGCTKWCDVQRGTGLWQAMGPTQPPIQWVPGALSPGQSGQVMTLTTHLHLVLRSRGLHGVMLYKYQV